jgi:hypothetical protein
MLGFVKIFSVSNGFLSQWRKERFFFLVGGGRIVAKIVIGGIRREWGLVVALTSVSSDWLMLF